MFGGPPTAVRGVGAGASSSSHWSTLGSVGLRIAHRKLRLGDLREGQAARRTNSVARQAPKAITATTSSRIRTIHHGTSLNVVLTRSVPAAETSWASASPS
ncbi:hypothetical protein [Cryobacterium aureum]|uniref:hypothetical protein n=1 Tax=Cryobacterium aureum TaxID=995037 RepID=UPI001F0C24E3|nr:hypothetical protein [Cryobacterium aureum]